MPKKNGVSGALGFSFACDHSPHAKLNPRTEGGHRTLAANMSLWIADCDIGGPPTEPWALVQLSPGPWPFRCLGLWVH